MNKKIVLLITFGVILLGGIVLAANKANSRTTDYSTMSVWELLDLEREYQAEKQYRHEKILEVRAQRVQQDQNQLSGMTYLGFQK